jgi:hypothetical protein
MHRVIQAVIRDHIKRHEPRRGAEVISILLPFLSDELLESKAGSKDVRFRKYLPHFLQVLHYLDEPAFRRTEQGDPLDSTVKRVVLQFTALVAGASKDDIPTHLAGLPKLVARYYEVDKLSDLLVPLLPHIEVPSTEWTAFRDDCLAADNYVLRYSLGEALGARALGDKTGKTLREIERLIEKQMNLNQFELGGYALKTVYSKMTRHDFFSRLIERFVPFVRRRREGRFKRTLLSLLAEHQCYPGRSILGDLMLNLVYQGKTPSLLLPPGKAHNDRFWQPIWDFVRYDVNAIRAAEHVNRKTTLAPEAEGEYDYRKQLVAWRKDLIGRLGEFSRIRGIVEDYFTIGADPDRITGESLAPEFGKLASSEVRARNPALFSDVLRLLFGHPLWSVAEAGASVLAALLAKAPEKSGEREGFIEIVESLFDPGLPWRVRYGAMETAYQIRADEEPKMATFGRGVKLFYNDDVSKLRGLCAENLFAVILNASDADRTRLEEEFDIPIREWLKDKDCWVLDHVHRYFHTLHVRGVDVSHFTSGERSPLFAGLSEWWKKGREDFLRDIEKAKEKAAT